MYTRNIEVQTPSDSPYTRPSPPTARASTLTCASLGAPVWLILPALALPLLLAGCADTRISVARLHEVEKQAVAIEPLELDATDLELTDFRPYKVAPGDVLTVNLIGLDGTYEESPVRVRVHVDGKVSLPLVGRIDVHGLDLEGVERAVLGAYVPDYVKDLSVFVELAKTHETTVVVIGAGGDRALVTLPRNQRNLLYALAQAGGYASGRSAKVHVFPIHPTREQLSYDLTRINDLRRALTAAPLESGDMVLVESPEPSAIYATGLLNGAGAIEIPRGSTLSVMRVVAAAGGLVDFLNPRQATLWRKLPNGEQVRVKLNLSDMLAGKEPDIAMRPGDILDVPHTAGTRFRQWFAENIQIGPFGVTAVYDPLLEMRIRNLRDDDDQVNFGRTIFETFRSGVSDLLLRKAVRDSTTGAAGAAVGP